MASAMLERVIGEGTHTYEVVEGWGALPRGVSYGYTHGVCEDRQGRILIHNMSDHAVVIFDSGGKFVGSWGSEFAAGAHGMQYSLEGNDEFLYLADIARHLVVKTALDGEVVWTRTCPMESGVYDAPEDYAPTNVAIAPGGRFYVADGCGKGYVHEYTSDAAYVRTWGGPGDGPGQLSCPHGIWVDTRREQPEIVVADHGNARLQYFTLDGEHLGFVNDDLTHPCHFDQRGEELLIPDLFGRVTIFNADNRLVLHLGENPGVQDREGYPNLHRAGRIPGKFISPHSAIWDREGNIFVVEWVEDGRVTKLERKK